VRYSSIENWSKNTFNLNTKRALVDAHGLIEWVNGNMGSRCTMLYPASILRGEGAKSDYIGIAFAGKGQHQDTGHKVYHRARHTSSTVTAKSISKDGGVTTYRGLLSIARGCAGSTSSVRCDALLMDGQSISNTIPTMEIQEKQSDVGHEATVGRISPDQVFYLMSRGLTEQQAIQMIVSGFIQPLVKELPLEYAVELNRLIQLEIEGSVG
jgi:Fe-S cluster assembly protein SufB